MHELGWIVDCSSLYALILLTLQAAVNLNLLPKKISSQCKFEGVLYKNMN